MAEIRVLIVDDHTMFRESLRSLLDGTQGIRVVGEAGDGVEAINKARQLQPDVVLMDIAMPNMGGVNATKHIKRENPSARVLALSMYETEQHVAEVLRAGAVGYIPKKAPASDLISAIQAVARGDVFLHPSVAKNVLDEFVESTKSSEERGRQLTEREREMVTLIAEGKRNQDIARLLNISIRTVQTHRLNLMKKLGIHDRVQLVRYAIREGIITP